MKKLILTCSAVAALAFASGVRAFEPEDVYVVVDSLTDVTFRDWKTKAVKGDLLAPLVVGRAYDEGKGTEKKRAEAVAWYKKLWRMATPSLPICSAACMTSAMEFRRTTSRRSVTTRRLPTRASPPRRILSACFTDPARA